MTTIKEFIDYLQTLPEDTIIQVVEYVGGDYSNHTEWRSLDINTNAYFIDATKNPFIKKDHPLYGKRYLELGIE